MTEALEFRSAMDNPAETNAIVNSLLADEPASATVDRLPYPSAPAIPDSVVVLPLGLEKDGKVYRKVEIKELTGVDEERIAKARGLNDVFRWLDSVLVSGAVSLEGGPISIDDLDKLTLGDREFLLTAIRKATFGSKVELGTWHCPDCREDYQAEADLDDLEVVESRDRYVEVPLKDGSKAQVRVPLGSDQDVYLNTEGTIAEQNTALLERVVEAIKDTTGVTTPIIGLAHSRILAMPIVDRRAILTALDDCQPGYRYDDLKVKHSCGAEFPAAIGVVSLFPGL